MRVGVLTVSDAVTAGEREDRSGHLIVEWVGRQGWDTAQRTVVADQVPDIFRVLAAWSDTDACDLVITTGGTGFAERDVTPEATLVAIDREAPGLAEAIRMHGLQHTAFAALGRGVAGIRGSTLIVNLPGSPAGVADGLDVLSGVAEHAVRLLHGQTSHAQSPDDD